MICLVADMTGASVQGGMEATDLRRPRPHFKRNHQGKSNVLLFPRIMEKRGEGPVRCRERLGGLLRYYYQDAA